MDNKEYMVVGNGKSKDSGKPYSKAYQLKTTKEGGFQYLDAKAYLYLEEIKPVGHKFSVTLTVNDK